MSMRKRSLRTPSTGNCRASVGGLGYLLAQQLVARGEDVLDVPATLASRIRVLATKRSNKNDPNGAHSIASPSSGLKTGPAGLVNNPVQDLNGNSCARLGASSQRPNTSSPARSSSRMER